MEALHDVVKAGKARYLGASSMPAWQFAKAQAAARTNGWTPFISMQPELSRERPATPHCAAACVA
jgi:aryl-alcohol dehydrogenase-like predicted oxidoreductase